MTASTSRKYNPGFLTDDELVASFCIRKAEFESVVEMLRDCTGDSNRHQIVIGPRGSGKTMLLLRVAAEVRRDPDLARCLFPIVFAEESYEVGTAGEFWLECLARLADQAPRREDTPDLRRTFEDLRNISDDQSLEERCLAALLDFSDLEGKRLVLLVENLNMMIADIGDRDAGWRLRKVLQTEPRIVLIASATSRFDEIDHPDHAMYDLPRTLTLRPLSTDQCAELWKTVSGQTRPRRTIRSLEILTGGSPRLLAIVARFGTGLSFRELMDSLLDLVDDHTEYFKSHLEALPPQERRVYLALADLWKPALTKEVAARARLETSKCSAQLARLVERGAVRIAGGSARRKMYYLSERLYNIYYLLRRNRGTNRLIDALIRFMASFYSPQERRDIALQVGRDVKHARPDMRSLYERAYNRLTASAAEDESEQVSAAHELLREGVGLWKQNRVEDALVAFDEFGSRFGESGAPELLELVVAALLNKASTLLRLKRPLEALAAYEEVLHRFGNNEGPALAEPIAKGLLNKGVVLGVLGRSEEGLAAYDEVLRRFGESNMPAVLERVARALVNKGMALGALGRPEEELAIYEEVLRRFDKCDSPGVLEEVATALLCKGIRLSVGDHRAGQFRHLYRPREAIAVYQKVLHRFGETGEPAILERVATALLYKGITLGELRRPEEAIAAYQEVLHRFGQADKPALLERVAEAMVNRGITLGELGRSEEKLDAYEEVLRRFGGSQVPGVLEQIAKTLVNKGAALGELGRREEELAIYEEVQRRFGRREWPRTRGSVLRALVNKGIALKALGRSEEALAAYERAMRWIEEGDAPAFLGEVAMVLVKALIEISVALGPALVRDAIRASPAAGLFLPLTTALEQEMGLAPRVAREVEEVAKDIRERLATLKGGGREAASGHVEPRP